MISTNILLGIIAGVSLFLGLPVARWRGASERSRGMLALVSAGVLLFLIIEVGYRAMGAVEVSAKAGEIRDATQLGLVFFIGFSTGLIGLSWLEEWRDKRRQSGANPLEVATVIAIGIGLYNFAEGLAIGHLFSGEAVHIGTLLLIGLALHNATEGLSIAGPLVGLDVSWARLLSLGMIGGGPTVLGAVLGNWVSPLIELFFLSMATGSLIYVTRELFRIRFKTLGAISAMTAVAIGVFIGFGTELVVQLGQARATMQTTKSKSALTIRFARQYPSLAIATSLVARGDFKRIENGETPLVFEGNGLFVGEVVAPVRGRVAVRSTGKEDEHRMVDELGYGGL